MTDDDIVNVAIFGTAVWATIIAGLVVSTYGRACRYAIAFWIFALIVALQFGGMRITGEFAQWAASQFGRALGFVVAAMMSHGLRRLVRLTIKSVRGSKAALQLS